MRTGRRLALVVGVNTAPKSQLRPLQSARLDAEAVADVLKKHCDFTLLNDEPLLEEQATSAAIKKAILDLMEQGEANDFLLFYFSGHGQPMDVEAGRNEVYLGTHDFVEKQVERDETLHLSLPWLRDKLFQQTEAEKVLLVLDCCYGDNLWRAGPDPYLKELHVRLEYYFGEPGAITGAPTGGLRLALTATGQNRPAQEGQAHGQMTGFLLPALRGEVPEALGKGKQLTVLRLVNYLQDSYEQPPLPTLSGNANQECVLATFATSQNGVTLPNVVSVDRPKNYLPFSRNPFFQPRPGEFEHLERLLFTVGTQQSVPLGLVGVTGMGGVGKTQLAVELAYRYQQRFTGGIFWMPATGQSLFDWQRTLAELAIKTNFLPPGDDLANPEHEALRARHLCRYFASHADVLVILDNVEVPHLVTTALADLAGGALACTVLYTSRQRTPLAGATLYSVEVLPEEGGLRLLLESTRPALLEEVLAGGTSTEAEAARQVYRTTGALPLALTLLQSLLLRDRKLSLHTLATTLQERGVLTLPSTGSQQATLEESFQLSWQQVRDERARHFFLLVSLFPEATPIPLWLAGLAAGLGERAQPFDPLWEINLSLQELSLLEGLADDQVRLHPLVRAFGQQFLQQEQAQGRLLRVEAGSRLVDAFTDLTLLEQRARRTSYRGCLEQLRAARDYALLLDEPCANQLSRLERWLDRESYLLADERWWPETIPGLFYQQFFNQGVETGAPLSSQESSRRWLKQAKSVGAEDPALVRIFVGHTHEVSSVAFSPDGRQILTGSADGTARLWETSSGRVLATMKVDTGKVWSMVAAFSPDGSQVFTGSWDGTAQLWETSSGHALATLQDHIYRVTSVAFSPDGSQILTGSEDSTVRLWETSSGRALATMKVGTNEVLNMAFSPDRSQILTGSWGGKAQLWETSSGRTLATLQGHTGRVRGVAFSPNGGQVLTGADDETAQLWETSSGRHLATLKGHTNWVTSVAFSPDGSQILTGSEDSTARLWEASSGCALAVLQGHASAVTSVAFSLDGRHTLTGSEDGTVRLWETSSDRRLTTLQNPANYVRSVAFSPDGSLVLTGLADGTARLWETSSDRRLATLQNSINRPVDSVAFSPDGSLVLTGLADGTARLWETSSGCHLATMEVHGLRRVWRVAFSPDGSQILTGSEDGTARLWETNSGRHLATFDHNIGDIWSVAFSPDGSQILTGSANGIARLWEASSGHALAILQGHQGRARGVMSVAFSPDGRHALTGSADGTVRLWETSSGRALTTMQGHNAHVWSVAFSPDGQLAVTSDSHRWNFFWRMSEPREEHPLGLYITAFQVQAVFWQDATHLLLADTGGTRGQPYIYRLSLEGSGWRE